jgi:hypothetical protein
VALQQNWSTCCCTGSGWASTAPGCDPPARIVDNVVPLLQQAGSFRTAYRDGETLRQRLGLSVADNRYARVKPS